MVGSRGYTQAADTRLVPRVDAISHGCEAGNRSFGRLVRYREPVIRTLVMFPKSASPVDVDALIEGIASLFTPDRPADRGPLGRAPRREGAAGALPVRSTGRESSQSARNALLTSPELRPLNTFVPRQTGALALKKRPRKYG